MDIRGISPDAVNSLLRQHPCGTDGFIPLAAFDLTAKVPAQAVRSALREGEIRSAMSVSKLKMLPNPTQRVIWGVGFGG
jgi:hypothetical protein